jgi:hypothetical protein
MEFGTWYQINCEGEEQWRDDFGRIREAGFDFVVLWSLAPAVGELVPPDVRAVVTKPQQTLRALDDAGRAGLATYLGIWHPYSMGRVRRSWRPQWSDGRLAEGPNVFNTEWLGSAWQPYVRDAGTLCTSQRSCRGVFLDDTFPATTGTLKGYLSYSAADHRRFRQWLAHRYGSVANLTMTHKLSSAARSFAATQPPRDPLESLPLWTDWMQARDEWCQDFIATARRALTEAEQAAHHLELVLSDQDFHMQCTPLQYGVDYTHLMPHINRLETYMAANHSAVSASDMLANVRRTVRRGVHIAGGKPFLFHTWFADLVTLQPMDAGLLSAMMEAAAEEGASAIEIYTFKVHDWRLAAPTARQTGQRPALRESSLKYHPELLAAVARTMRHLKSRYG